MLTTFFLSFPRCRTAWLSMYLTGMGVYCFHELWRTCSDIDSFRDAMESKGPGPVANADPTNLLFLDQLQEAFPDAIFIEIIRPVDDVMQACIETYGPGDYTHLIDFYARAKKLFVPNISLTVPFDEWNEQMSSKIFDMTSDGDVAFNHDWHTRMHQLNIAITHERVEEDKALAKSGEFLHMAEAAQRLS